MARPSSASLLKLEFKIKRGLAYVLIPLLAIILLQAKV